MSWHPDDLVTDRDLEAYEADILRTFGQVGVSEKRTKACEDWLYPILEVRGFDPFKLRTRYDPTTAFGYTGSAYTDIGDAVRSTTDDDVDLAAIWATPGTDRIYVRDDQPFRGLFLRVDDSPNATASVLTVKAWTGSWETLQIADDTQATDGTALSRGGAVRWALPRLWTERVVNDSGRLYWVELSVSATPAGATAGQVACVRSSRLRGALAYRTLFLIMSEAQTSQAGPWSEKADRYEELADVSINRALDLIGGEFDTDDSGQVSATEEDQTIEEAGGGPWSLERG